MTERRRTADRVALLAVGISLAALAITIIALLAGLSAIGKTASFEDFEREANARRDETCRINEHQQEQDIRRLRQAYEYLDGLPAWKRERLLRPRAARAQLASLEADAMEDDAPAYCDEPDVGLPEPDPELPPRPGFLG